MLFLNLNKYSANRIIKMNQQEIHSHIMPRTWLTREDAFANEWHGIRIQLELNSTITAKVILKNLIKEKPDEFKIGQLRTLQRRIMKWHLKKSRTHQEIQSKKSPTQEASSELYDVDSVNPK